MLSSPCCPIMALIRIRQSVFLCIFSLKRKLINVTFTPVFRANTYPSCDSWGGVIQIFSCNAGRRCKHLFIVCYKRSGGKHSSVDVKHETQLPFTICDGDSPHQVRLTSLQISVRATSRRWERTGSAFLWLISICTLHPLFWGRLLNIIIADLFHHLVRLGLCVLPASVPLSDFFSRPEWSCYQHTWCSWFQWHFCRNCISILVQSSSEIYYLRNIITIE